jgi:hypothetical protein
VKSVKQPWGVIFSNCVSGVYCRVVRPVVIVSTSGKCIIATLRHASVPCWLRDNNDKISLQ